jgi:hypothetical protein
MNDLAKIQRVAAVARAFTPSAPVSKLDMLAGRMNQLTDIVSAVSMTGQHVGLYGERGVGKTSLANVLAEFFNAAHLGSDAHQSVVINCTTDDSFQTIWRSVFLDLGVNVDQFDRQTYTPEGIRRVLDRLDRPALIVLDELDRLADDEALTAMADTIKTLSDHTVETTIVLVGVARSIGDLVGEHASIVRALVQIEMPRMSMQERGEILEKGCARAQLTAVPDAIEEIATSPRGFPTTPTSSACTLVRTPSKRIGTRFASPTCAPRSPRRSTGTRSSTTTSRPRAAPARMRCSHRFSWPAHWRQRIRSDTSHQDRSATRSRSSPADGWRYRRSPTT